MKIPREKLDELKRRGVKVVGEKPPATKPRDVPQESAVKKPVVAQPTTVVVRDEAGSVVRSEAAAVAASASADKIHEILREIVNNLASSAEKSAKPVAYKFTMNRDRLGRIAVVIATPIPTKE